MDGIKLQQLRVKYRKIIECQDSDEQNEDIRKSISFMRPPGGMRVLTEHCENLPSSNIKDASGNSVFVALKERIAQGLKNIALKDQEINTYKQQLTKQKLKMSLLQSQLAQSQTHIQQKSDKISQQKAHGSLLEKEIQKLKHIIEQKCLDKQLVLKQSDFYKKQIKDLKNQNSKLKVKLQQQQKDINLIQTLKNNNNRLKQNIKRMQEIIDQCCKEKVNLDLTDKHYIGKPLKQYNCWFPQNLVGEVEAFLKKWQIGYNNRDFTDNLVKFIDQIQKKNSKPKSASKPKPQKSTHKKRESKHHYTLSQVCLDSQPPNKSLKKSILINKYKKRNQTYTGSLFEDEKQLKATKIIEEYQNALTQALKDNEVKPRKILELSQQLKQFFANTFQETKVKIQS